MHPFSCNKKNQSLFTVYPNTTQICYKIVRKIVLSEFFEKKVLSICNSAKFRNSLLKRSVDYLFT